MDKTPSERKIPEAVSEPIRLARAQKRLSRGELGERSGTSLNSVKRLEAGSDVTVSTLSRIAGALGLAVRITNEAA